MKCKYGLSNWWWARTGYEWSIAYLNCRLAVVVNCTVGPASGETLTKLVAVIVAVVGLVSIVGSSRTLDLGVTTADISCDQNKSGTTQQIRWNSNLVDQLAFLGQVILWHYRVNWYSCQGQTGCYPSIRLSTHMVAIGSSQRWTCINQYGLGWFWGRAGKSIWRYWQGNAPEMEAVKPTTNYQCILVYEDISYCCPGIGQ